MKGIGDGSEANPPAVDRRAEATTLWQRRRQGTAIRELKRLIREAPTPTIRNDLMAIAARNDRIVTRST